MISINMIIAILAIHYIADFILQTDWMAQGKSKKMLPLMTHIMVYTSFLAFLDWRWALVNGTAHLVVDFFTSRGVSYLWNKGERHYAFALIGLDQLIHYSCLFSTWEIFK